MEVLLLEDDDDTALALGMLFEQAGISSHRVRDGHEALQTFSAGGSKYGPDVLVLDPAVSDMTTTELGHALAELPSLPPVVVYSARPPRVLAEFMTQVAAAAFLMKPARRGSLVDTVLNVSGHGTEIRRSV